MKSEGKPFSKEWEKGFGEKRFRNKEASPYPSTRGEKEK
jgi:hypothetical protein